jgi:very-short-patch-repair endonuclease
LGLKFRRQHRIGRYIVDFYCAELRLAIEVDGGYHESLEQYARDIARTAALGARSVRVIRLRNLRITEASLLALIRPYVPPLRSCGEGARG